MKGLENISEEVAKDLIELVNSITGFKKSKSVNYRTKNGVTAFHYVPLDDILKRVKRNNNFALMQPIGSDENGKIGVKCVLIHKSGHVIESDTYPFQLIQSSKIQDEGAEITYRKRYALGAFLGISTEEDNDGNVSKEIDISDRKATQKQVDILIHNYKGDQLNKLLKTNNIEKIEDISFQKATELVGIIFSKGVKK